MKKKQAITKECYKMFNKLLENLQLSRKINYF